MSNYRSMLSAAAAAAAMTDAIGLPRAYQPQETGHAIERAAKVDRSKVKAARKQRHKQRRKGK